MRLGRLGEGINNLVVKDAGHVYLLHRLDALLNESETLVFVKRLGIKYPNNFGYAHSGTTIQEVCRALIDRFKYVHSQDWYWINPVCISALRIILNLLELRAAKRHNRKFVWKWKIELLPFDIEDGHIKYE